MIMKDTQDSIRVNSTIIMRKKDRVLKENKVINKIFHLAGRYLYQPLSDFGKLSLGLFGVHRQ